MFPHKSAVEPSPISTDVAPTIVSVTRVVSARRYAPAGIRLVKVCVFPSLSKTAEAVATAVEKWVEKNSGKGEIDSIEIRDKVIEVLKEVDPVAAENFMVYKKG